MVMLVAALSSSILLFIPSYVYPSALILVTFCPITIYMFTSGKILLFYSSVAFLSILTLSISPIPKYGTIGASIGYSSITVVSFFIMYHYARKYEIVKF